MKRKAALIILLFAALFASCTQEIPEDETKNMSKDFENRFEGEDYYYYSYQGKELELMLKSKQMAYDNINSKFDLINLYSKIKSNLDYVYLVAKKGTYLINTKDFTFSDSVRIVIEKRYLLEGPAFQWLNEQKILKSDPAAQITVKDKGGMLMQGMNFVTSIKDGKFNMINVSITIPENTAEKEGFN